MIMKKIRIWFEILDKIIESNRLMATLHQFSIDPLNQLELFGNTASIPKAKLIKLIEMPIITDDYERNQID